MPAIGSIFRSHMEQKDQTGFFGDVKDFILKLLIGLAPIATLVPMILNKTHSIFSISYDSSFLVFTLLYFILPVTGVFLVIWYKLFFRSQVAESSTEERTGADPKQKKINEFRPGSDVFWVILWLVAAMIVVMAIAFHLVFDETLYHIFLWTCLISLCFLVLLLIFTGLDYFRIHGQIPRSEKLHTGVIQYLLLMFLLLFGIFVYVHSRLALPDTATESKDVHKYIDALRIDQDMVKPYPDKVRNLIDTMQLVFFRDGVCKDGICDSVPGANIYKYYRPKMDSILCYQLKVLDSVYRLVPDSNWDAKDRLIDSVPFFPRCMEQFDRQTFLLASGLDAAVTVCRKGSCVKGFDQLRGYSQDRLSVFYRVMGSYKDKLDESTREKWSILLKRVQLYCFLLFGSAIAWLLTLWLYFYIHSVYRQANDAAGDDPDGEPILKPLRTCTMILLLLCIPFIRNFDKSSLDLTNPFLHFSLQGIIRGGQESGTTNIYGSPTEIFIDSSRNSYSGGFYGDTLRRIMGKIDAANEQEKKDHQNLKDILIP
jgi:hypothetical protein